MRLLSTTILLLASLSCSYAQVTLRLSSATVSAGQTATLNLTAASGGTASALQWTLTTTADIVSIKSTVGSAATSAGKTLSCNGKTCLLSGMNNNIIPDGVVGSIALTLSPTTAPATQQVQFSNIVAASPTGNALTASGTGGVLTVTTPSTPTPVPPASLSAFTCAATVLHAGDSTVCTLSFTGPAPTAGVAVVSAQASLQVPATVSVPAGATSVSFTATSIDSRGFDSMTASYGGVSITLSVKGLP